MSFHIQLGGGGARNCVQLTQGAAGAERRHLHLLAPAQPQHQSALWLTSSPLVCVSRWLGSRVVSVLDSGAASYTWAVTTPQSATYRVDLCFTSVAVHFFLSKPLDTRTSKRADRGYVNSLGVGAILIPHDWNLHLVYPGCPG